MNKRSLLPLAFLAWACSSSPPPTASAPAVPKDALHEAVSTYLRKTLDDPASYQPVRWGPAQPLMRADSASIYAMQLMSTNMPQVREKGYALMRGPAKDSTTQVGQVLRHAFRAKNKMGGLVLDSADFAVYSNGGVAALPTRGL